MDIDPAVPQDDKAQKLFILCAINPADGRPYPLVSDPTTLKALYVDVRTPLKGYEAGPDAYKFVLGYRGGYKPYEDASFVTGETGRVLNVATDLGRNAHRGYIANDGPGDIGIEIAEGTGGSYGDSFTLKPDDSFPLDGMDVNKIKLTHIADTGYRIVVR